MTTFYNALQLAEQSKADGYIFDYTVEGESPFRKISTESEAGTVCFYYEDAENNRDPIDPLYDFF